MSKEFWFIFTLIPALALPSLAQETTATSFRCFYGTSTGAETGCACRDFERFDDLKEVDVEDYSVPLVILHNTNISAGENQLIVVDASIALSLPDVESYKGIPNVGRYLATVHRQTFHGDNEELVCSRVVNALHEVLTTADLRERLQIVNN